MDNNSENYASQALKAEREGLWFKSNYLWEKELIETVNNQQTNWYGKSLVILSHIYDIFKRHYDFKSIDKLTHTLENKTYKPVGNWAHVEDIKNKITEMQTSTASTIAKIILAVVLLFVFFVMISYPFSDFETYFLAIFFLIIMAIIAIFCGLMINFIAGVIAFFVSNFVIEFLSELLQSLLHLPSSDVGMLYIFRFIIVIVALFLFLLAYSDRSNNKKAAQMAASNKAELTDFAFHSKDCCKAVYKVLSVIYEEDIPEIAAMKSKNAYLQADEYGFARVTGSVQSGWDDALRLNEEILDLSLYYADMVKLFNNSEKKK
ncbi:MAG: hypothetical protein ACI4WG_04565 [Erysipelotrichaceae bacterium]